MNLGPNPVNTTYQYLLNQSGSNITLGNNEAVNWDSANVVTKTGTQTIGGSKTFTSNLNALAFGNSATSNSFGDNSTNSFGQQGTNLFGSEASSNYFGFDAVVNTFGNTNGPSTNYFGDGATNYFGGGQFLNPINLNLPLFEGSSSQAGKFGELRVSGSGLYVCTGATGGWRRTFLQSF